MIVLTTTYCYMNIALKLPVGPAPEARPLPPKTATSANDEGAKLLEEGDADDKATPGRASST